MGWLTDGTTTYASLDVNVGGLSRSNRRCMQVWPATEVPRKVRCMALTPMGTHVSLTYELQLECSFVQQALRILRQITSARAIRKYTTMPEF